jgi:hypothetical protein
MPPCPPAAEAPFFSSEMSATNASVVSIRDAIEPALVRAVRTTLAAMLLHRTQVLPITLQSLHSGDLRGTGKVEVHANFHSNGRRNAMLESALGGMSLEPAIPAMSWQVLAQEDTCE